MDLQTTTRKTRRVVLYGAAGTRKTTTAAQFPKPLVVQDSVARGAEFLKCPKATLTSADELGDAMKLMREGKFQTLVLDDFAAALRRFVDGMPESKEPRRNFALVNAKVVPVLRQILCGPWNVVITAHHEVDQEVMPVQPWTRTLVHTSFAPAVEMLILGLVDVVGYCYNNGTPSALVSENASTLRRIVAKHRVGLDMPDVVALADFAKVVAGG
jgi:hypothetical protein